MDISVSVAWKDEEESINQLVKAMTSIISESLQERGYDAFKSNSQVRTSERYYGRG